LLNWFTVFSEKKRKKKEEEEEESESEREKGSSMCLLSSLIA